MSEPTTAPSVALTCDPLPPTQATLGVLDTSLVFPGLLERDALLAGDPLAGYLAMRELEDRYLASPRFGRVYPELRLNAEEFLGVPCAPMQGMALVAPSFSEGVPDDTLEAYAPEAALETIRREAARTRVVIWGEEHHLPQTRSLYESMLDALWDQGYRYLAAEAFEDNDPATLIPVTYQSGYYLRDPVFASAVRHAAEIGYTLVSYDTRERGDPDDVSFRDRTQAQNLVAILEADPEARMLVLAGRSHASEVAAPNGWTPMAHVLKEMTGIDPYTLYAPTMSERIDPEREHPLYRLASDRGLLTRPTVFRDRATGRTLGSDAFDAYVFWPRTRLVRGRPDWMVAALGRRPVPAPARLLASPSGPTLIQAFPLGAPPSTVPHDQILIDAGSSPPVLMLRPGRYWLRSLDSSGVVVTDVEFTAPLR